MTHDPFALRLASGGRSTTLLGVVRAGRQADQAVAFDDAALLHDHPFRFHVADDTPAGGHLEPSARPQVPHDRPLHDDALRTDVGMECRARADEEKCVSPDLAAQIPIDTRVPGEAQTPRDGHTGGDFVPEGDREESRRCRLLVQALWPSSLIRAALPERPRR